MIVKYRISKGRKGHVVFSGQIDPCLTATCLSHQWMNSDTSDSDTQLSSRVLIIGRANAGKTLTLQRVCETTESRGIYCSGCKYKKVHDPNFCLLV